MSDSTTVPEPITLPDRAVKASREKTERSFDLALKELDNLIQESKAFTAKGLLIAAETLVEEARTVQRRADRMVDTNRRDS